MKMKNWMRNAGFTLVELIVVIAVLGILGAGAAVGYSGYVKKANKAADEALVAQVKYALEVAYVADPTHEQSAQVVLSADAAPDVGSDAWTEAAMESAFGNNWTALRLQYSGWGGVESDYSKKDHSFKGKETELLGDIQRLTDAVNGMISDASDANNIINQVGGGAFGAYLDNNGVIRSKENSQRIANSAALFVADQVTNLTEAQKNAVIELWKTNDFLYDDALDGVQLYAVSVTGLSTMGAMAAFYANTEAMVQYVQKQNYEGAARSSMEQFVVAFQAIDFTGVSGAQDAWEKISTGYSHMFDIADGCPALANYVMNYCDTKGADDAAAFISVMNTVDEYANVIGKDLARENMYTNSGIDTLLKNWALGSVVIQAERGANSACEVTVTPRVPEE